ILAFLDAEISHMIPSIGQFMGSRRLPVKYKEKVKQHYPEIYEETKNWAIKIKKHEKSDEFDLKKTNIIGEESTYQIDLNVDELANAFSELKIYQLTKLVRDIANNKSQPIPTNKISLAGINQETSK
ncbi:10905_t:CDS:2, partial [Racocetra persica]